MSGPDILRSAAIVSVWVLGGGIVLLILITIGKGWWDRRHTPTRVDTWAKSLDQGDTDIRKAWAAAPVSPAPAAKAVASVPRHAKPDLEERTVDVETRAILLAFDKLVAESRALVSDRSFHDNLVTITREFDRRALMVELNGPHDAADPTLVPVGAKMEEQ